MKALKTAECCGCTACEAACPVGCITMRPDRLGFLYPETDESRCVGCGKCLSVCPAKNPPNCSGSRNVYAATCKDGRVFSESSSGGVFSTLAAAWLKNGGVVFGVEWNDDFMGVRHNCTERIEELGRFRNSKYLQSDLNDTFVRVKRLLVGGRRVLFSGTPCQVAGLYNFLGGDDENLLSVDIACHGVPAPAIWRSFIRHIVFWKRLGKLHEVVFRGKRPNAAGKVVCTTFYASGSRCSWSSNVYGNIFGRGLLSGMFTRPSCDRCPIKPTHFCSDITVGDFWGADKFDPRLDPSGGLSVVVGRSEKGAKILADCREDFSLFVPSDLEKAEEFNDGLSGFYQTDTRKYRFMKLFSCRLCAPFRYLLMMKYAYPPFSLDLLMRGMKRLLRVS